MKIFNNSVFASVLMAGLLACTSSNAAIIEFTSRAAFSAATTGQTVEPNSAPPGQLVDVAFKTINGITYPDYAFMVDPAFAPSQYEFSTGPVLLLADESSLSFGPVFAFAADFATIRPPGGPITITIDGISFVLPTSAVFELTFYGFISTTPFTSVSFVTEAEFIILDNVTLANAAAGPAPVPEPESIALLGLALAALAWSRRRR
ncbi:MAG: PEP-CTERM sorting domain-containing protein [Bdellovibrionales bacterium]|nr:PEP-CTERM sorting domain-containing protein [Massilia sp.]